MKIIFDYLYKKTNGFYPFFKYCPVFYRKFFIQKRYKDTIGKTVDLSLPKTLNEKIRWLVYNEKLDLKTRLTDKLLIKDYYKLITGEENYAKVYGVWDSFNDIDIESLPEQFILKTNHGWRMNVIIHNKSALYDKQNYAKLKKLFTSWIRINYELYSLEPQYKKINRKIYAEEFVERGNELKDCYEWQIHCFNGTPTFIELSLNDSAFKKFKERPNTIIYNTKWELQPFYFYRKGNITLPEPPKCLNKILEQCKKLSQEFSYVRIDFMVVNDDLFYILEMTFTPDSAMINIFPKEYDNILGDLITLPTVRHPKYPV